MRIDFVTLIADADRLSDGEWSALERKVLNESDPESAAQAVASLANGQAIDLAGRLDDPYPALIRILSLLRQEVVLVADKRNFVAATSILNAAVTFVCGPPTRIFGANTYSFMTELFSGLDETAACDLVLEVLDDWLSRARSPDLRSALLSVLYEMDRARQDNRSRILEILDRFLVFGGNDEAVGFGRRFRSELTSLCS